jgi:LuxR family maltose regulon positive regulatory protein
VSGTAEYARRALELIPEGDLRGRATGTALLALACWANGELERAHATFTDALGLMRTLGAMLDVVRGTFVLGDIRMAQGRLREARSFYERGLELAAAEIDPAAAPETDELYLGLSELHIEWGDLSAAEGFLSRITRGAERADHRGNRGGWCATMAGVRAAAGDLNGALALLEEAEAVQIRGPVPRARPFGAIKARIWAKQGRTVEAMGWLQERGSSVDDELEYLREYEHVTLAKVLIARREESDVDDALDLLERLAAAAEAGGRTGSLIEISIVQALARRASGNVRSALAPLGRALSLAEPEGFLRVFLDEGEPMRDLLRHAVARGIAPEATRRVLSAFDQDATPTAATPEAEAGPASSLTPKEVVILRLIAEGLRNQEIADHLFISPATVKRHIANTYAKLGVGHRTEALVRAKELNLL